MSSETIKRSRRNSRLSLTIAVLISAVLLYLALRGQDFNAIADLMARANLGWLLTALAVNHCAYLVRAFRWSVLVRATQPTSRQDTWWIMMVGYLVNSFLPARAGDMLRSYMLAKRSKLDFGFVMATTIAERIVDVIALGFTGLLAASMVAELPTSVIHTTRVGAGLALLGLAILIVSPQILDKIGRRFGSNSSRAVKSVSTGLKTLSNVRRAGSFASWTVLVTLFDALTIFSVGKALGVSLDLGQSLLFLACLALASIVPSTPGYVGVFQYVAVTLLPVFGTSSEEAIAVVVVLQAVIYVVISVWGLCGLFVCRTGRPVSETIKGIPVLAVESVDEMRT